VRSEDGRGREILVVFSSTGKGKPVHVKGDQTAKVWGGDLPRKS